jgi:hypothetical protein
MPSRSSDIYMGKITNGEIQYRLWELICQGTRKGGHNIFYQLSAFITRLAILDQLRNHQIIKKIPTSWIYFPPTVFLFDLLCLIKRPFRSPFRIWKQQTPPKSRYLYTNTFGVVSKKYENFILFIYIYIYLPIYFFLILF